MEKTLADYLSHAPVFIRRMDGEIVYWTEGSRELYGFEAGEAVGHASHDLLRTHFPESLDDIDRQLREEGEWRGRLRHATKDGREIWTESLWRLRDRNAGIVVEQNTDITERIMLERHRDMLALELDHRVKNTLAVVQGLARLSFGGADQQDVQRFERRLVALSNAHNLLQREFWQGALLRDVIANVTDSLGVNDRVSVEGPEIGLTPTAAVSYALAFHELGTNAMKHGALRLETGRIAITWSIEGDDKERIYLVWRESGGPPVKPPANLGFGSRLISRIVARQLGTPVRMHFEEGGLVCEFDGPIEKEVDLP